MRNYNQCESGLIYNEFSVILIQTFTSAGIEIPLNPETNFFIKNDDDGHFANQLFTHSDKVINRYRLKGFDICIDIDGNTDRKSTRLNSSHIPLSRMPSSA